MSTINYTYNVIVDRFRQFAAGHFQLRRFTHGEISQADLEKEAEWPWLHVKPRAINYSPGTRSFQFEIFISDLPRDKEDKTGYQAESITDCSLIFQDLINEIYLGNMFGSDVVLSRPVNSEPFVEQYTHTLTGVTGTIELQLDYDWSACSIPASWNYNTPTDSGSDGWGALQFIESLDQNGVYVSLLNDEETPGNSYYYGTDSEGVKGWHAIVDNIGLTCETLPECATIISIVDDIAALQSDKVDKIAGKGLSTNDFTTAEQTKLAGIEAGAEVNVNADWNATSGDAQILNKPTIPSIAGLVPETRTLTINGTTQDLSANRTFTIATGLTVGTTPITSGTIGRVLFEGTGNVLQQSANLFWDATNNRLGIGTSNPSSYYAKKLVVACPDEDGVTILANTVSSTNYLAFADGITGNEAFRGYLSYKHQTDQLTFGSAGTLRMTLFSTGNLGIATTTDAGYKLDVNGTARVQGNVDIKSVSAPTIVNIGGFNELPTLRFISNNYQISLDNTNTMYYAVGNGAKANHLIFLGNSNLPNTSTTGVASGISVTIGFAPTSGTAAFNLLNLSNTINQTGGANGITRGLYINPTLTSAADFRAIEVAAGTTVLAPSVTARASLRIPSGTAPTSPVNGDIWFDGTNIQMRIGGVTKTFTLI
jgi:hypothetical protein